MVTVDWPECREELSRPVDWRVIEASRNSSDCGYQRVELAAQIEKVLDAHPLVKVLTSMPGVGVRTAARVLLDVGDATSFPTAGHLAAYAGLAPVTRRSGTSIRGEFPSRTGNRHLKRALFLSSFAALRSDPISRAYYDRKRAQGQETQRRPHLPIQTALRRPLRDAPKRTALPNADARRRLPPT